MLIVNHNETAIICLWILLAHVREFKTAFASGFQVLNSSLCQWNLDSGFQSIVGNGFFELYSGFHMQNFRRSRIL